MKKVLLNLLFIGVLAGTVLVSSCSDDDEDEGSSCYVELKAEYDSFNAAYSEYESDDSNSNCIAVVEAANSFFETGDSQGDCDDATNAEELEALEWFEEVFAKVFSLPCIIEE